MPSTPHPKELYELVRLVRGWLKERTGRTPTPHEVAQCLAGAYGIISGLGHVNDRECASIQEESRRISAAWKAS